MPPRPLAHGLRRVRPRPLRPGRRCPGSTRPPRRSARPPRPCRTRWSGTPARGTQAVQPCAHLPQRGSGAPTRRLGAAELRRSRPQSGPRGRTHIPDTGRAQHGFSARYRATIRGFGQMVSASLGPLAASGSHDPRRGRNHLASHEPRRDPRIHHLPRDLERVDGVGSWGLRLAWGPVPRVASFPAGGARCGLGFVVSSCDRCERPRIGRVSLHPRHLANDLPFFAQTCTPWTFGRQRHSCLLPGSLMRSAACFLREPRKSRIAAVATSLACRAVGNVPHVRPARLTGERRALRLLGRTSSATPANTSSSAPERESGSLGCSESGTLPARCWPRLNRRATAIFVKRSVRAMPESLQWPWAVAHVVGLRAGPALRRAATGIRRAAEPAPTLADARARRVGSGARTRAGVW